MLDKERIRLLRQMEKLARCRVNDAVKLAFLGESELERIDELDLTPLTLCPGLEACCLDNAPEGSVVPARLPMEAEEPDHSSPTYEAILQWAF